MANSKRMVQVLGNWKMNHTLKSANAFFTELKRLSSTSSVASTETLNRFSREKKLSAGIFAPTVYLSPLRSSVTSETSVFIGAQNAHWADSGAYTGETSGAMLKDLSIDCVLVGHSERRQYFGETNETVHKRSLSLLKQGLRVVACVGETLSEREAGQTQKVLAEQIRGLFSSEAALAEFKPFLENLTIAYEPVWAIGTGKTASPEQANEAHVWIRGLLREILTPISSQTNDADKMSILYGGSVTPENFSVLLAQPEIDGGLVGGASVKPESYFKLLEIAVSRCS
jgi:triosephosphate isomerase